MANVSYSSRGGRCSKLFAVLDLYEEDTRGLLAFLRRALAKPRPVLEESTALGKTFYTIHAPLVKGTPDWWEIAEAAGAMAGRMLLPDRISPPENSSIKSLPCSAFFAQVLLSTACALIQQTRLPLYRRILGLIDPEGAYTSWLPHLLKHYSAIRVCTGAVALYEDAAEQMMEELGATVMVSDSPGAFSDCVLALCPAGAFQLPAGFSRPLLAGEPFPVPVSCDLICQPVPPVPAAVVEVCPPGIAPHRLAAALYEHANLHDSFCFVAERLLLRHQSISLAEIVNFINQRSDLSN